MHCMKIVVKSIVFFQKYSVRRALVDWNQSLLSYICNFEFKISYRFFTHVATHFRSREIHLGNNFYLHLKCMLSD